jgi:cysteine synthase
MSKYSHRFELKINESVLKKTVQRCKERNIILPTFEEQRNPDTIPEKIKNRVKELDYLDVNPLNLFRITWKNNVETGLYQAPNFLELPSELTGVKARIVGLVGTYFPTGAHKVGAAYGCLAPRLASGNFDPTTQKAVWPSTGNYCRGGAFDCALLACPAIAILPEEMSQERFDWLKEIGTDEIFATPGCESNVKEIYDKCWELRKERGDNIVIFNQFDEFGNSSWHYYCTGSAVEEVFNIVKTEKSNMFGWVSATGSAGTLAAGDYLKKLYPTSKIVASEALQCPTILQNGFGGHRIEGIGDKHIPWIHNVRNTDMVVAVDDENCMRLLRVFNDPAGHEVLKEYGIAQDLIKKLPLMGISSISNVLSAIKAAKYWDCTENDVIFTSLTDSAGMYESRLLELNQQFGKYDKTMARVDFERYWLGEDKNDLQELNYQDRKRVSNLKYFTWVEQQGKTYEEILELWDPEFWDEAFSQIPKWDKLINEFNSMTGLLD